jgi:sulfotransferase family protein
MRTDSLTSDPGARRRAPPPDFALIGAPKAGTTSVYHYMSQHPAVFAPKLKEPHFFSCPESKVTYYPVPFVDQIDDYINLYRDSADLIRGDFSPSYLLSDRAAGRLHSWRPDMKIIMVLRSPIDRAISHYFMDIRLGLNPFTLAECLDGVPGSQMFLRAYIDIGLYSASVQRYLDTFSHHQVHIELFEELASSPEAAMSRMFGFIGAGDHAAIDFRHAHNAHQGPRPHYTAERAALRDIFRADVGRLGTMLSRDLTAWL